MSAEEPVDGTVGQRTDEQDDEPEGGAEGRTASGPPRVELDRRYRLSRSVSLRPERFGALAYHFDTRKLSFLKHPDLVRVVESLDGTVPLREALLAAGVDERRWPSFLTALTTLETSEMIHAA
jgi:mycofactocin biosynthesis protein MftB